MVSQLVDLMEGGWGANIGGEDGRSDDGHLEYSFNGPWIRSGMKGMQPKFYGTIPSIANYA